MTKKVVLSGYYGADNFGDEAILEVLVNHLKEKKAEITILSSNPFKTEKAHKVRTIKKFNLFKVIPAIMKCDILVSGGGSLLQDVTSSKSLFYYLFIIFLAQFFKKDVIIFAQGIGPINSKFGQNLTKSLLKKCRLVTVRDDKSLFLLRGWGIKTERVCDPIYDLEVTGSLPLNKVGIQLRAFKTLTENLMITLANRVAFDFPDKEIEIYSFQDCNDLEVCNHFKSLLLSINKNMKVTVVYGKSTQDMVKDIANLEYMIAMRYHAILVALKYGIKTLAINYDNKVEEISREAQIPALSMLANEDYGYMFNRMKNLDKRAILEYINSKHFNWDSFDSVID